MSSLREIFINNLKFYRKEKRISQEKLSYAIDMGMNYINQIENKSSFPPPETIEKIANVLGIKPIKLFCEDSSPMNIDDKFLEKYSESFQNELSKEVQKAIDTVCLKMRCQ